MTILTPYLPREAENSIREHYHINKMPAFLKAVEMGDDYQGYCPNCAGLGIIIVQYADKGPFKEVPTTAKTITYYQGDGTTGRGWYIIGRTAEFTCPHCKGERHIVNQKALEQIKMDEASRAEWAERVFHKPQAIGAVAR